MYASEETPLRRQQNPVTDAPPKLQASKSLSPSKKPFRTFGLVVVGIALAGSFVFTVLVLFSPHAASRQNGGGEQREASLPINDGNDIFPSINTNKAEITRESEVSMEMIVDIQKRESIPSGSPSCTFGTKMVGTLKSGLKDTYSDVSLEECYSYCSLRMNCLAIQYQSSVSKCRWSYKGSSDNLDTSTEGYWVADKKGCEFGSEIVGRMTDAGMGDSTTKSASECYNSCCNKLDCLSIEYEPETSKCWLHATKYQETYDPSYTNRWVSNIHDHDSFQYLYGGNEPSDMHCVVADEPSDTHTELSDNFFCSSRSHGYAWSYAGPIDNKKCLLVNEPGDKFWDNNDNFLCYDEPLGFDMYWSYGGCAGQPCGYCILWFDPTEWDGWKDNHICFSDIDECALDTAHCGAHATCINFFGGFDCECDQFYHGDGYDCPEINECDPNPCQNGAKCTDKIGEYECTCPDGFEGINCQITSCEIVDAPEVIQYINGELVKDPSTHAVAGDELVMTCPSLFLMVDDASGVALETPHIAICRPDVCTVEENILYEGNDIKNEVVDGVDDCCAKCGQEPECLFWTFTPSDGNCYLKTSDAGRDSNSERISGGLVTEGGGGWNSTVDVRCYLPAADMEFSGRSVMSTFASEERYQVFDVSLQKVEFDFDGSLMIEDILSVQVTGYDATKLLLTDQPGMKEPLQGATFYQIGYSLHGDDDPTITWADPGVTHCGCIAPADLAPENTFFSHHPGCFELTGKSSRMTAVEVGVVKVLDIYELFQYGSFTFQAEDMNIVLQRADWENRPIAIRQIRDGQTINSGEVLLNRIDANEEGPGDCYGFWKGGGDTDIGWQVGDLIQRIARYGTVNWIDHGDKIMPLDYCSHVESVEANSLDECKAKCLENNGCSSVNWAPPRYCNLKHCEGCLFSQAMELEGYVGASFCDIYCDLEMKWGPSGEEGNDIVYRHQGDYNSHPYYQGNDGEDLYIFHSAAYWVVDRSLGDITALARVRSNAFNGQDIFEVWEVLNNETESYEYAANLVLGCVMEKECTPGWQLIADLHDDSEVACVELTDFTSSGDLNECQTFCEGKGTRYLEHDDDNNCYCLASCTRLLQATEISVRGVLYQRFCDPVCETGVSDGSTCCRKSCGSCGGSGCSELEGGAANCCGGVIADSGVSCFRNIPPCIISVGQSSENEFQGVYRGGKGFYLVNSTNGECAEKCREVYPAEDYGDLFISTWGHECYCTMVEPTGTPLISDKCSISCTGDGSLEPSTCGGNIGSSRTVNTYRANTMSNLGFLPMYTYPYVLDKDGQTQLGISGAPREFKVHQKRGGIVEFQFTDSSTCEDRFEYRRANSPFDGWLNLLDFDLELVTRQQCGFQYTVEVAETVGSVEDEVQGILIPGKSYEFLLRMNTVNVHARSYVASSVVSDSFVPFWESVLTGVVLTKANNPVANVAIQVTMPNGGKLDSVTDLSGTYEIWLPGDYYEAEQIIHVVPYLKLYDIAHEFECGALGKCTSIEHPLQMNTKLSSLQLEAQRLDFVDTTIVDIKGTVYVQEPSDPDLLCPEEGVKVCIHFIKPERMLDEAKDCMTTPEDGQWTHQIVVMRATVEITAERNGAVYTHSFVSAAHLESASIIFEDYMFEQAIVDQNFYDVTSRKITARVYGGTENCETDILNWKIAAIPVNCPTFEYATYYDESSQIALGAQEYTLMFLGEDTSPGIEGSTLFDQQMEFSISDIFSYFEFYQPEVNLTDVPPNYLGEFIFEYHLPATIVVSDIEDETTNMDCPNTLDFLSLEHGETYDMSISVSEVYSKDSAKRLECKDVPGILDMFGLTQRGPDPPEGCADPGTGFECQLDITYDYQLTKSEVSFKITPVNPSLTLQFLAFDFKTLIANEVFDNFAADRHVESVYVMGTRKLEPGTQVPLPESVPLLVLREPPGDGSYSFLSRGSEVSIDIAMASEDGTVIQYSFYQGFGTNIEVSAGIGIIAKVTEVKIDGGVPVVGDSEHYISYATSAKLVLTLEEDYRTSGGIGAWFGIKTTELAKTMTDMFLTPAFNLEVSEAQIFELVKDNTTNECNQHERRSYAWSLPDELLNYSEDNNDVAANLFSWYSEYQIVNFKIPELERMIANHDVDCPAGCLVTEDCDVEILGDSCYDQDCMDECPTQLMVMEDALTGWNDTLKKNEYWKDNALPISATERLKTDTNIKAYANMQHSDLGESKGMPYANKNHGMEDAQTFYDKATDTASHYYPATFSNKKTTSEPSGVHMMTFSGGGSQYTYRYTTVQEEYYENNEDISDVVGAGYKLNSKVTTPGGFVIKTKLEDIFQDAIIRKKGRDTDAVGSITTSFTLADDDIGDDFTVDILEDENGWLYFRTVGGKSSCPHEFNTTARQSYAMTLNLETGDSSDVYDLGPDDVVHWDIVVSNESPTFDAYNMNLKLWSNNEGLIVFANGLPFIDSHGINIDASTNYTVHITGQRPQGVVNDFSVQFMLVSECEFGYAKYLDCTAHYISNCPTARFAETYPWVLADSEEEEESDYLEVIAVNDIWRTNPWGPTSDYDYEKVSECNVLGSDSPFDTLGHGDEVIVTCSKDCTSAGDKVIGCPENGGLVHEDSSICKAAIASNVFNEFNEFLLKKTTAGASDLFDQCTVNGVATEAGTGPANAYTFEALSEDELTIQMHYRTLSPFGTMPWDPWVDFNFAHFPMNFNGRTSYIWEPSINLEGDFELQLGTNCPAADYATDRAYSEVWAGNIDRDPPQLVPFPEPQDGIYERGDKISFQFNEPIVCDFSDRTSHSGACVKDSEEPTSCDPIQHYVFCPEQGTDGNIQFVIDNIEEYEGKYLQIAVSEIVDLHMKKNDFPQAHTFYVSPPQTMLLSIEPQSLTFPSDSHQIDLFATKPSQSGGILIFSDNHLKLGLGDSKYAAVTFKLEDFHPEIDYLSQFVDCTITYSIEFDELKVDAQQSITFSSSKETVTHGVDMNEPSIRTFTSGLECSRDEVFTFSFYSSASESTTSSNMWLNTLLELQQNLPTHEHYQQELSQMLGVSPEIIQPKDSRPTNLLSRTDTNGDVPGSKIVFEISESENERATFRDVIEVLNNKMRKPISRTLLPLTSASEIRYDLVTEPKVCDEHQKLDVPHIVYEKSKMLSMEYLHIVVEADARYNRLEFSFQDAPDQSARFEYEPGTKPIPSGFWTQTYLNRCTTQFTMKLPWSHLDDYDVIGLKSLKDNLLMCKMILNVESWEADRFGSDYRIDARSLKFQLVLEDPAVQLDILMPHNMQIETSSQAIIGEGVHIDIFTNHPNPNENGWTLNKILRSSSPDLIVRLGQPKPRETENQPRNELLEINVVSMKNCEFMSDDIDLEFTDDSGEIEIVTLTNTSTSLCAKVEGPACVSPPVLENTEDLSHCANTKHGESCKLVCFPGYDPSSDAVYVEGKWEQRARCTLQYFLTDSVSFLSAWTACSLSNAHLAVVKSEQENHEVEKLCKTSTVEECFIGLVPAIMQPLENADSLRWVDGSDIGFQNWQTGQTLDNAKVTHINGPTGLWIQTSVLSKLPAVCQVGNCVPSPEETFLTKDIPPTLRVRACTDVLPQSPVVHATNGCEKWQVPVQTDVVKGTDNPNHVTVYNMWTLGLRDNVQATKHVSTGQTNTFLSQVIEVIDEPPRFITELNDISVACEDYVDTPPEVEAIDDCDVKPPIEYAQTKLSNVCPFVVHREWTTWDRFGGTTYLRQVVRVGF